MPKDTLFQILSRQPWWITLLVAFGLFWVTYSIFPPVAPFVTLPFLLLAGYIGFIQWRKGSPANAGERLSELRAMSWEAFSDVMCESYRRQGYAVSPADGPGHDFRLTRDGRITLLQCRRWKVNQVGETPVRELATAIERNDAARGICVTAGEFSAPAKRFATGEPITLIAGGELAELTAGRRKRRSEKGL